MNTLRSNESQPLWKWIDFKYCQDDKSQSSLHSGVEHKPVCRHRGPKVENRVRKLKSKDFCAGWNLKVFASENLKVLQEIEMEGKTEETKG